MVLLQQIQYLLIFKENLLTCLGLERYAGFGPASPVWKARAQPLYQYRITQPNFIGLCLDYLHMSQTFPPLCVLDNPRLINISSFNGRNAWTRTRDFHFIRMARLNQLRHVALKQDPLLTRPAIERLPHIKGKVGIEPTNTCSLCKRRFADRS